MMGAVAATRRLVCGGLVTLGVALSGCGPLLTTPPGFVEVEGQPYDYRAASADGLVIGVRVIDHEPKGDLAFWVRAMENELRLGRGYALLDTRDVKTAKGLVGKELHFGHDEGSSPHLYCVALFVTKNTLYVIEAGGAKELVEKNQQLIDTAIKSLDAS
jgi:hypothetical protein